MLDLLEAVCLTMQYDHQKGQVHCKQSTTVILPQSFLFFNKNFCKIIEAISTLPETSTWADIDNGAVVSQEEACEKLRIKMSNVIWIQATSE